MQKMYSRCNMNSDKNIKTWHFLLLLQSICFKKAYLERQTPSFCPDLDAFFMANSNNVPNNFLQIMNYMSDKLTQGIFCARPKPDNFCCTVLIYTLSE